MPSPPFPPIPRNSPPSRARINALSTGNATAPINGAPSSMRPPPRNDSLGKALLWTFGSMVVSIAIYSMNFGLPFATGFVLLILIHELGHVVANMYYGMKASPPIFIPYLGAVINLRQSPPNAKVEAVIGIGGPVFGAAASILCGLLALRFPPGSGSHQLLLELSFFGCFMNLFNLLPVPPLDGGRVTAAVSPWIWMLGVLGMAGLAIMDFRSGHPSYILVLLAFYAFPRIWRTLTTGERNSPLLPNRLGSIIRDRRSLRHPPDPPNRRTPLGALPGNRNAVLAEEEMQNEK